MDRREKLLQGIHPQDSVGAEIGALCSPFLRREDGKVIYVDHADTETLRAKYRADPNVRLDEIVEVDAVWGQNTLREAIGRDVDYVVASHVVEHVPDLIGWLGELASVLADNGEVRLIVPDKRFTYDYLRHETRFPEVLYASLIKARIPQPNVVLEYIMNVVKLDGGQAWRGGVNAAELEHHHSVEVAQQCAMQVLREQNYHDVHCWVFTPHSFGLLFSELAARKLIPFECAMFFDTAPDTNEFFVGLRKSSDAEHAAQTWKNMAASAAYVETEPRLQAGNADRLALVESRLAASEATRHDAERERAAALSELEAIRLSRTWRLVSRLVRANLFMRRLMRFRST